MTKQKRNITSPLGPQLARAAGKCRKTYWKETKNASDCKG